MVIFWLDKDEQTYEYLVILADSNPQFSWTNLELILLSAVHSKVKNILLKDLFKLDE